MCYCDEQLPISPNYKRASPVHRGNKKMKLLLTVGKNITTLLDLYI